MVRTFDIAQNNQGTQATESTLTVAQMIIPQHKPENLLE